MTCPHGYPDDATAAQPCGICVHLPGECDWGSCHDPATTTVETVAGDTVRERRPMCARHAAYTVRRPRPAARVCFREVAG